MSEKSALHIHTRARPPEITETKKEKKHLRRRKPAHASTPSGDRLPRRHVIVPAKPDRTERLLRNSALACAVLLAVLTIGNIDRPWARKAAEGIEQALTMRIDLDDTIGELTFVKELMPESALVFLNISGKDRPALPVDGTVSHPWSAQQPWLMFACQTGTEIVSAESGTVTAVSPLSDGRTGVLIDHGNGTESVYASLEAAQVANGDAVARGQVIGTAGDNLYFEWRVGGESIDPTEMLGL